MDRGFTKTTKTLVNQLSNSFPRNVAKALQGHYPKGQKSHAKEF